MTMEAIAGKNPVSHVGKIYNVMAQQAASDIAEQEGVLEAYVTFVSKIGSPISQPLLRGVRISGDLQLTSGFESHVNSILDYRLESADSLIEEFAKGRLTIYHVGLRRTEREDPTVHGGDESGVLCPIYQNL
jgi:S-adenosylmethionine synthetase